MAADSWEAGAGSLTTAGMAAAGVLVISAVAIAMLARGYPRLGALVVGAAFVALNVLNLMYLPGVEAVLRPWGPARLDWAGAHELLQTGIVGMIGIVLVVSALAPRRWHRASDRFEEEYLAFLTSGPEPSWSSGRQPPAAPAAQGATLHGAEAREEPPRHRTRTETNTEAVTDGGE